MTNRKPHNLTHNQVLMICNALNAEAKAFDDLAANRTTAPKHSRQLWREARDERRALVCELLTDKPGAVEPVAGQSIKELHAA